MLEYISDSTFPKGLEMQAMNCYKIDQSHPNPQCIYLKMYEHFIIWTVMSYVHFSVYFFYFISWSSNIVLIEDIVERIMKLKYQLLRESWKIRITCIHCFLSVCWSCSFVLPFPGTVKVNDQISKASKK